MTYQDRRINHDHHHHRHERCLGQGPGLEKVQLPAVEESAANSADCELFTLCKDRQNEGKYAAIGIYKDFEAAGSGKSLHPRHQGLSSVAKFRAASPGLLIVQPHQQVFEVID